jgi:hypothetical protein
MKIQMLFGALVLAAGGAVLAQPAQPAAPAVPATPSVAANPTATPRIDRREANQQKRIDQGVASGQLTPRETRRLEAEQGRIAKAEEKAKADGKVTGKERAHLTRMENHASRDIAQQKHDRQRVAPAK